MTDAHAHALRLQVAAAALGLDPSSPPSHSAVAWAVAHAVAVECGRKPDDAAEIASRWATIADMAAGSPAEDLSVFTDYDPTTGHSPVSC